MMTRSPMSQTSYPLALTITLVGFGPRVVKLHTVLQAASFRSKRFTETLAMGQTPQRSFNSPGVAQTRDSLIRLRSCKLRGYLPTPLLVYTDFVHALQVNSLGILRVHCKCKTPSPVVLSLQQIMLGLCFHPQATPGLASLPRRRPETRLQSPPSLPQLDLPALYKQLGCIHFPITPDKLERHYLRQLRSSQLAALRQAHGHFHLHRSVSCWSQIDNNKIVLIEFI
jgi:hypothetical protein